MLNFLGIFLILSAILSTFRCNRSLSGIVFVIYPADKRHHTRIFQTDSRDICTEKQKIGGHKRKYAVLGKIAQPIFDPLRKRCFISVHCISSCQYYSAGAAARLLPKDSFYCAKSPFAAPGKPDTKNILKITCIFSIIMRGIFQDKAQSKRGDLLHRNSILNN